MFTAENFDGQPFVEQVWATKRLQTFEYFPEQTSNSNMKKRRSPE